MASANSTDKLIIFKGDDTGGVFGRHLAFTIEAGEGVDLSGCHAEWIFDGIVKTFAAPLIPGEVREVFYSHNETRCMALGVRYGTFRIIDASGKVRTLTNTKPVEVTNNADRCYPGSSDASFVVRGIGDMKHSEFADLEEKEGMTLKEVGGMVNTLIRKLKGTVSAFAALLAFGAFCAVADGAITPDTDFGDISPTAKLKAVVEASGAISGIDTNAVDALANSAVVTNALTVATTNRVALLESSKADKSDLDAHVANTNNPHAVTAEQVGAVPFVKDKLGEKTAVTIGSRKDGEFVGEYSFANGGNVTASGNLSHAEGWGTTAAGDYSHADGYCAYTKEQDNFAFAWNGDDSKIEYDPYESHGVGTFNINPVGGLNGFWIGEQTLYAILTNKADKADIYTKSEFDAEINEKISGKQDLLNPGSDIHVNSIETDSASNFGNIIIKNNNRLAFSGVELSPNGPLERIGVLGFGGKTAFEQVNNLIGNSISATNPTFSNAVLAVGLNIDTNSVAVLNDIASTFGGFPLGAGETATTVGGLLAALAAAAAWLKKNKVGSFASVGGASATVENGVAKLDDFFTNSNSLLAGTIDARLPYPLYAVPSTGVLKDRAINTTSLASVTVPENFTDLLIRASVASSLSVTMPEATTKYGDTFPGEAGEYLITITKTGAAEAYVRTIKLEEVA